MPFIPFKRNYAKPGPGITPDEPEKFGVARFSQILSIECGTVLKLNLMTLFASIPIITIPPALCAMNAVIRKMMVDEPVMCFADFRDAFAKYWKQSYLVFLLGTLVPIATCVSSFVYARAATEGPVYFIPCIICLFLFVLSLLTSSYLYPLLSVGMPLKETLRYALLLGIGKPLRAAMCFLVNAGMMLLTVWFFPFSLPYLLLIGLTIPCLVGQFLVRLNLRKYVPRSTSDADEPERAQEREE